MRNSPLVVLKTTAWSKRTSKRSKMRWTLTRLMKQFQTQISNSSEEKTKSSRSKTRRRLKPNPLKRLHQPKNYL